MTSSALATLAVSQLCTACGQLDIFACSLRRRKKEREIPVQLLALHRSRHGGKTEGEATSLATPLRCWHFIIISGPIPAIKTKCQTKWQQF